MLNYHIVQVKYYGPTNTQGSRVQLYSPRLKEKVWLSYDYAIGNIAEQAIKYLKSKKLKCTGRGEFEANTLLLVEANKWGTFESIK